MWPVQQNSAEGVRRASHFTCHGGFPSPAGSACLSGGHRTSVGARLGRCGAHGRVVRGRHAAAAWLCGYLAFPGPWFTPIPDLAACPQGPFRLCLSHTPDNMPWARRNGVDLMLSGHTHGGQICLPGGIPITLDAKLPRRMGSGLWKYRDMVGYTSVGVGSCIVPVRINCPPEIALHHLRCATVNTGDRADEMHREPGKIRYPQ